ncbi:unnamed protein product [Aspergillus oryzae]|uniref:Unnamed protein product n=3 Tax=Aspergillus oryzae TaxID=5062 RepID=A0A1S9DB04_ASPOZ|nr:unnamed protein product [Aspergillus oryzae RIB40]OOO06271.1 hypothetical protein OAory_01019320 [Aspergillus oryzae]GMG43144.1 unnamed protein product [Aspergillus oryzae var. brunneus]BAE62268.1 unnamed protein product [Aspergillus oryzae RIB40]GMF71818.1 unnamed protein product [Aspergillus oryzae]GMF85089.1 unnamed protein product [Aspergillus oryzae]
MSEGYALRREKSCMDYETDCGTTWNDFVACCPSDSYCPGGESTTVCRKSHVGSVPEQCANGTWNLFHANDFFCCDQGELAIKTVNTGNRDTDGYVGCVMSDYASVDWLSTLTVMRSGTGMSIIHYFTIYRGNKSYSSLAFATKRRLVSSTPTSSATLSSFTSVSTTSSISTTHTAEPTPSNSSSPSTPSSSTNTGAIAGGVVGGVAGAAILAALVWFLARRSKAEKVKSPTSAQDAWDMRTARDSSKFQQYPVQKLDAGLGPTPPPVYELPDATSNRQ